MVNKLRLMEQMLQQVDDWLRKMEEKVSLRTERQSNRATKEMLLHQMKVRPWKALTSPPRFVCFMKIFSNCLSKAKRFQLDWQFKRNEMDNSSYNYFVD
jgi:hypothetical protein